MHRSNGPIGRLGCKLSAPNVYFKQRIAEATATYQLITTRGHSRPSLHFTGA